jgi:hypothetical protein
MKMNKTIKTILPLAALAGLAGLGLTGTASAALAAVDFNAGGTDTGFASAWNAWGGSSNLRPEATGDLTYANYGIVQTGTGGKYYSNSNHPDRQDSSALSSSMSGDMWFSILVNVEADGNFAGISFHSSAPSQAYFHSEADLRVAMSDSKLLVDWGGNAFDTSPDVATGSFSAGTHLILGSMTVGVGNDTLSVWVDPDVNAAGSAAGLGAADYTNSSVDFTDSITHVGMPGDRDTTAGGKVYMDAIRVSNNASAFVDVTGVVPEPSTTALLGLGGLALILRRRK